MQVIEESKSGACLLFLMPGEIRNMIWSWTAANGAWLEASRTCSQIRAELTKYMYNVMPSNVESLEKLVWVVDSSYVHGRWLMAECTWREKSHLVTCSFPIQGYYDEVMSRIIKMRRIHHLEVRLVAPSHGDLFGSFLMMWYKVEDLSRYFRDDARRRRANQNGPVPSFKAVFTTERGPGEWEENQSHRFWETRFEQEHLDNVHRAIMPERGPHPYVYEYFLIAISGWRRDKPDEETPAEIHLPRTLNSTRSIMVDGPWRSVIAALGKWEDEGGWRALFPNAAFEWTEWICFRRLHATDEGAAASLGPTRANIMECLEQVVRCFSKELQDSAAMYVDHHVGPEGGPLDMLRLHRFKIRRGFHALPIVHQPVMTQAELESRTPWKVSLLEAQHEVEERLYQLFNPLATVGIRELRTGCQHLAGIQWAADPIHKATCSPRVCSPRQWIEAYPKGIRFAVSVVDPSTQEVGCQSLASWRNHWTTNTVESESWVVRLWECFTCCQEATAIFETLSSPLFSARIQNGGWRDHPKEFWDAPVAGWNRPWTEECVVMRNWAYQKLPWFSTNLDRGNPTSYFTEFRQWTGFSYVLHSSQWPILEGLVGPAIIVI
jgi:hypothetical protein